MRTQEPLGLGSVEDEAVSAPTPTGEADEPVGDEGDGGFSDADRIVRVWVQDGRLTKVRISPVWFTKLTGKDTLAGRFGHAFQLSQIRIPKLPSADDADPQRPEPLFPAEIATLGFQGMPRLNKLTMAAFDELFTLHRQRFAEELAKHPPQPTPSPVVSGRSRGVTVHLNSSGWADSVEFDEKWLDDAHVGMIANHVLLAAEAAYARFDPAEPQPSPLDGIRTERQVLRAAYLAMLQPDSE